jgi:hypothetical protein
MTYTEMLTDTSLHLFFYGFGLISGIFVSWIESKR